jgi:hypothetical protein
VIDTTLQQGEFQLGRYKVRYAHFTSLGWDGRGPWMRAIVTNWRVILIPDDASDPLLPCVIAGKSISRVWHVSLGRRDGVILALGSGQLIYLFIDWAQGRRLVRDIREMLTPPAQPRIVPRMTRKSYLN